MLHYCTVPIHSHLAVALVHTGRQPHRQATEVRDGGEVVLPCLKEAFTLRVPLQDYASITGIALPEVPESVANINSPGTAELRGSRILGVKYGVRYQQNSKHLSST